MLKIIFGNHFISFPLPLCDIQDKGSVKPVGWIKPKHDTVSERIEDIQKGGICGIYERKNYRHPLPRNAPYLA